MIAIIATEDAPGVTTALGVAGALARSGEPTIVADVDDRAPGVHVAAGIAREPTLAALPTDRAADVVQEHPRLSGIGVVPAPLPDERVAIRDALARLTALDGSVLVHCPIGAGPVLAAVLSQADRILFAVGGRDRGLDDAAAIADVARRRTISTAGVVLHDADRSSEAVEERVGSPILATVPESQSAATSDRRPDAFDAVASALKAKSYATRPVIPQNCMVGRLETGIDVLDRKLDGGLPPGCVVAYTASPASQSELLLYELTAARGTLYLTTERTDDVVRHAIETSQARVGSPTVRYVASDQPIEEAHRLIGALPDGANLIVDTMNPLERTDRDEYLSFLNGVKTQMLETGSIALLHCLKGDFVPENRSATEHVADAVFDLETTVGAAELENYLSIPKFRGGGAPTERIKLELSDEVTIDTSRDIA